MLHPLAAKDITDILRFIASDSPQAAGRVRQDMLSAILGLVHCPHQGHRRLDLTSRPLRFSSSSRLLDCLRRNFSDGRFMDGGAGDFDYVFQIFGIAQDTSQSP